ncbi:MAG: arylsulfatase, partial [Planctomycetaceae bacterium]|nr:arylsulfatase [Planctomycetaceae bacterium]
MRWFHVATALLAALLLIGPAGATRPNIVLLMADDMGYCDIGCYGGEIETPHLDRLAAGGLRFTQFYNAARCCPTRAALLTGLYPHQAGVGQMVRNRPSVEPHPNQGYLNRRCVTIAEVLRTAGYDCYMSGKWHVGEFRPAWPIDRGFHRYYGLISGAMNYFDITQSKRHGLERVFARDAERVTPAKKEFYATDAFTDEALTMLRAHPADRPFFLYLAFNAPHWPLHAPPETIRKYENRYA